VQRRQLLERAAPVGEPPPEAREAAPVGAAVDLLLLVPLDLLVPLNQQYQQHFFYRTIYTEGGSTTNAEDLYRKTRPVW